MMDASEIGLIPVHQQQQPRSESHDLSIQPTTPEAPPTLSLNSPPVGSPMMDNHPSPASLGKLDDNTMRHSHPHSVHTPEGGSAMNLSGQIKRKRGRPRKYNYDPAFPPQVPVTSARLSLPASLTDMKAAGLMSSASDAEPAKRARVGRPPLKETPKSPNVDISESAVAADANGEHQEKSKVNQHHQHLASQQQENNHPQQQQQQNHSSVQHHAQKPLSNNETNKHQAAAARSATQSSTIIAYSLPINGHGSAIGLTTSATVTDASAPSQALSSVPQTTSNVATGTVSMKAALMMDYYNSPFITTQFSGPAAALMSPPPPTNLPTQSPNPASAYSTVDINLLYRLLPQVTAAVTATRSGGYPGPHTWTKEMVASFISMLSGCQNAASAFIENDIDGQALLVLGQQDLMTNMKLKLGPAAKIAGAIRTLRHAFMSLPAVDLSADQAAAVSSANSRFPALGTASSALTGNNSLMLNAPFSINSLNGNGDNQIGH
ncbi:unnamed protein product [Rodentolepis nana]|uniref:SAM domain-containing protein n=1 Tax=Rodentolepis nana TaxID=102285 RepID=A0A0R3TKS4_RODNA|nr:unnamed protein product [Rodentolepis nana]